MPLDEKQVKQLLRTIKYGSSDDRLGALMRLAFYSADIASDDEEVIDVLANVLVDKEDANMQVWGAIAMARLGFTVEPVKFVLLQILKRAAKDPLQRSRAGTRETEIARALSGFRQDEEEIEEVTKGLIAVVQAASIGGYADVLSEFAFETMIEGCLQAIGTLGHPEGKDFLRYWVGRMPDNDFVAAALRRFGSSWDEISREASASKQRKER